MPKKKPARAASDASAANPAMLSAQDGANMNANDKSVGKGKVKRVKKITQQGPSRQSARTVSRLIHLC